MDEDSSKVLPLFRRHMVFTDVDPGSWDTIMNTASQILVENTGQVMMDFCWGRWVAEIGFTRQDIGFTHARFEAYHVWV